MTDDYFSDENIKQRVDQRITRFRRLFIHVALAFAAVFGTIFLAAAEIIAEPLLAVLIVIAAIFSIMVHGMFFGLTMMREGFTEEEYKAAQQAAEKGKYDDMALSEDGELMPLNDEPPFYDEADASQQTQK